MSYLMTRIVRAMRMPRPTKRRPECRLILESLAQHCTDDGRRARPSLATLALESEIGKKVAALCLLTLTEKGLIRVLAKATPLETATYSLDLEALAVRVDDYGFEHLNERDQKFVAALRSAAALAATAQTMAAEPAELHRGAR